MKENSTKRNIAIMVIAVLTPILGMALYMLFLFGGLIHGSFAEAKSSGGRSVLALAVFLILLAVVFTLMNRCTE